MSQPKPPMDKAVRTMISGRWNEAWTEGLWSASWAKSLEGLTPTQAAWQPPSAPGIPGKRHSIWQLVLHMCFWRESWLRRLETGKGPTNEELAAGNFPAISDTSETAWSQARQRFGQSQDNIAQVLATRGPEADIITYFLPHDMYHFGQVNYLRAMLGLPPIE